MCNGCKRFQAAVLKTPVPGLLRKDRMGGSRACRVIGTDCACRVLYMLKSKKEGKSYILIFECSLPRAIHLELPTKQTVEGFI